MMNTISKKITIFVLTICASTMLFAQNFTLSMRDVSVKKAMTELESKSGYTFVYSTSDVDTGRKCTVNANRVEDAVNQILNGQNLSWVIDAKTIVLSQKTVSVKDIAPSKSIVTGVILDGNGEPVIGAVVQIKDSNIASTADLDGKYSIQADENSILEFKCLGYKDMEERVGKRKSLNVTMLEDVSILDEVVVMGYGTTTRKNLTTAIATVKPESISKAANSNLNNLLLGRAAGLQANIDSPQPGGSMNISIRGAGTPVYIVDGVMMPSSSLEVGVGSSQLPSSTNRAGLNGINPADIESIEILKDASAAIYGIDAANGVILITTKKGSAGKAHIEYDGSVSIQQSYPYLQMVGAAESLQLLNTFSKESYLLENGYFPYGNTKYIDGWTPLFSDEYINSVSTTDWMSEVLRNGFVTNHNLSVRGGNDKVTYFFGVNYYNEKATVRNSDMQRITVRTNVQAKLTKWMKLTAILNVNNNDFTNSTVGGDQGNGKNQRAGALYGATVYPTYLPVKDEEGNYSIFYQTPNPLALEQISDKTNQFGIYGNASLDIDIVKGWLSAKAVYGINREATKRDAYIPEGIYFALRTDSRGNYGFADRCYQTLEGTLQFQHSFWGDVLDMNVVAGMGLYLNSGEGLTVTYENANDHINSTNLAAAEGPFYEASSRYLNEKRSQFIRGTFNVLNRYVISATLRRDGTDKFHQGKKYALFPSVSFAWKITEEPFMRNVTWINMLKIRGSIGSTGSDNLGTTLYGTIKNSKQHVTFDENTIDYIPFVKDGANYSDVTWQKTVMKNIGLDFSLLKDRIWGSVDVFRNDITNLLGTDNSGLLDYNAKRPVNYGHYYRAGVDFELNAQIVKSHAFNWTVNTTFSKYNAVWVKRQDNYAYKAYQLRENEPVNISYYYEWDGLVNTDKSNIPDSQKSLGKYAQMPGFPIIVDKNGDGEITVDDACSKNLTPDFYFGLNTTLEWKNFDLTIATYGQVGVLKENIGITQSASAQNLMKGNEATSFGNDAYKIYNSQNAQDGVYPGIVYTKTVTLPEGLGISYTKEDASFLRIRNITLGYTFDEKILKSASKVFRSIRVYADFQNPFTFTKFTVYDPEITLTSNNLKGGQYPINRVYSAGLKLNF